MAALLTFLVRILVQSMSIAETKGPERIGTAKYTQHASTYLCFLGSIDSGEAQKVACFSPLSHRRQPGPAGEKCQVVLTAFFGVKVQIIESSIHLISSSYPLVCVLIRVHHVRVGDYVRNDLDYLAGRAL